MPTQTDMHPEHTRGGRNALLPGCRDNVYFVWKLATSYGKHCGLQKLLLDRLFSIRQSPSEQSALTIMYGRYLSLRAHLGGKKRRRGFIHLHGSL